MTEPTKTLEIRHRILLSGTRFIVAENFGDQPEIRWNVPDRATADKIVAERRELLTEMVASISKEARQAVEDARDIDNMKAGRA